MTPKTVRIRGQDATLFRDDTPPIYVLPDGRYALQWGDQWVVRGTLRALEKITKASRPTLKIMRFQEGQVFHSCECAVVEAAEFLDAKIIDKDGKRQYKGWGSWFLFDQEMHDALMELEKRRKVFEKDMNKEFERITKKARHVYTGNFKELLDRHNQAPVTTGPGSS